MVSVARKPVMLLEAADLDEVRTVSAAREEDGALLVTERTDGEITYQVFGTLTHVRVARVGPDAASELGAALGSPGDPELGLRRFFARRDVFLSDLLDLMDARGLAYGVAIGTPEEYLLRTA